MNSYHDELSNAMIARSMGNEGKARVCARRAAGIIIGEYLKRQGFNNLNQSAYDRLSIFNKLPNIDPYLKVISTHFLLKVNHDHELPGNVDLIAEVQTLQMSLLKEPIH